MSRTCWHLSHEEREAAFHSSACKSPFKYFFALSSQLFPNNKRKTTLSFFCKECAWKPNEIMFLQAQGKMALYVTISTGRNHVKLNYLLGWKDLLAWSVVKTHTHPHHHICHIPAWVSLHYHEENQNKHIKMFAWALPIIYSSGFESLGKISLDDRQF